MARKRNITKWMAGLGTAAFLFGNSQIHYFAYQSQRAISGIENALVEPITPMVADAFKSPKIDLSTKPIWQLYFGDRLDEYSYTHEQILQRAKSVVESHPDLRDTAGQTLLDVMMSKVPCESDSMLIVLVGNSHVPVMLKGLRDNYNLRYYSPFADQSTFFRDQKVDYLLDGISGVEIGSQFTSAVLENVLDQVFPDRTGKPFAVVIGDIHGFDNAAINELEPAGRLKQLGIKRIYAALEGFNRYMEYGVEDIGNGFPSGTPSPVLPEIRKYLEGARECGIEIAVVPIEYRIKHRASSLISDIFDDLSHERSGLSHYHESVYLPTSSFFSSIGSEPHGQRD